MQDYNNFVKKIGRDSMTKAVQKDYSCYVSVKNQLSQQLSLVGKTDIWGHWQKVPTAFIKPNATVSFHLQEDRGGGGVEGSMAYAVTSNATFHFSFGSPRIIGSNYAKLELQGTEKSYNYTFRCKAGGQGDTCLGGTKWQNNSCPEKQTPVCVEYVISPLEDYSCYIAINNQLTLPLKLDNKYASEGHYIGDVPLVIQPKGNVNFQLIDEKYGSRGGVIYSVDTTKFQFIFQDPYGKDDNVGSVVVNPNYLGAFTASFKCNSGDHPEYMDNACPSRGHPVRIEYVVDFSPARKKNFSTYAFMKFEYNLGLLEGGCSTCNTDIGRSSHIQLGFASSSIDAGSWLIKPEDTPIFAELQGYNIWYLNYSFAAITGDFDVRGSKGFANYIFYYDLMNFNDRVGSQRLCAIDVTFSFGKAFLNPQIPTLQESSSNLDLPLCDGMLDYDIRCSGDLNQKFDRDCQKYLVAPTPLYVQFHIYNTPLPRSLTPNEIDYIQNIGRFIPKVTNDALVFSEISPFYNSLAWVLGRIGSHIWPSSNVSHGPVTLRQASDCLNKYGYGIAAPRDPYIVIDAWGQTNNIIHFSTSMGTSTGDVWSSKLGTGLGLFHPRDALKGGVYGMRVASFKRSNNKVNANNENFELEAKIKNGNYFSDTQKSYIKEKIDSIDNNIKEKFYKAYSKWNQDCINKYIGMSSVHFCNKLDGINNIKAFGEEGIIMLINQLSHNDFFALAPYNVLQTDRSLIVHEETTIADPCNVNAQVVETVNLWLAEYHIT